jgi:SAM-dependent methyltransferase
MWRQVRFAKNAAFGQIPFAGTLRTLKRKWSPYPTGVGDWTMEVGFRQMEMMRDAGCDLRGKTLLEIGTGWQPVVPLLFSLVGCARVIAVDRQRLMDFRTFVATVRGLAGRAAEISRRLGIPEAEFRGTLSADGLTTLDEAARRFRLDYRAPPDVTRADLPDASVDLVTSRAVLEHIPPGVLKAILATAWRILRPGGLTCHAVDNSDHWSHRDKRLSRVNFLRYSDGTFGVLSRLNPLDHQNRLRHFEYLNLLRDVGFEIVDDRTKVDKVALAALDGLPLAGRFTSIPHAELAKTDSYILARKPCIP